MSRSFSWGSLDVGVGTVDSDGTLACVALTSRVPFRTLAFFWVWTILHPMSWRSNQK